MNELVTCIIPTYNRAALLERAVESICRQTYPHWELIVVDDRSTDGTPEAMAAWQARDSRIRYFVNPNKKGPSAARNYGISQAKGAYIAFLDDDDISLPHRFASQLGAMLASGSGFLVSGFRKIDSNTGAVLSEYKLELPGVAAGLPSRWMIKKELLDRVGGFDESLFLMEDPELSYRLSEHEVFAQHDDIVTEMLVHSGSISQNSERNADARLYMVRSNEGRMPSLEAAWWYYIAGLEYYALRDKERAKENFSNAAERDPRGIYRLAFRYFLLFRHFGGLFRKVNIKVLSLLGGFKFPVLAEHPVVK